MGGDRAARAADRQRAVILKSKLGDVEADPTPLDGEQAVSLVHRLTLESWALAGLEVPAYSRKETPYRFVTGFRP